MTIMNPTSVIKAVSDNFHTVVDDMFEAVAGAGPTALFGVGLFQQVVILYGVVLALDKLKASPHILFFAASQLGPGRRHHAHCSKGHKGRHRSSRSHHLVIGTTVKGRKTVHRGGRKNFLCNQNPVFTFPQIVVKL